MIVITGASDGLGKELARLYKKAGKKVVSISRHESDQADESIIADLTDSKAIKEAVSQVLKIEEPIEALVNCAGVFSQQPLSEVSEEELERVIATNTKAPVLLVAGLIDRIRADGADIVNVSSTVGTKAYSEQAAYGVSKWGLRGFSQNLQVELKNTPCRVISFCPGGFKSKLFEKFSGHDNTEDGSQWMKSEDVALCLKQTLDLPKNMEVSEIVINRKAG